MVDDPHTKAITGKNLIDLGYAPATWFKAAIAEANSQPGQDLREIAARFAPPPALPLRSSGTLAYHMNIEAEDEHETANIAAVEAHMVELMRVPTVFAGAVMPDACPASKTLGTIPVGGVIAAKNAIHPGMHSADICCSMAISVFGEVDATSILDAGMTVSHFGGGGRPPEARWTPPADLLQRFESNAMLKQAVPAAAEHFGTQGDGNHFFYVGRLASTGAVALVTHHGSRKPGAMLYKIGMSIAERARQRLSPETAPQNAWIEADSRDGQTYWEALQLIRAWTKASHFAIHDAIAAKLALKVRDRFWNEHNFVFQKSDGLFYHAKGATPAFKGFAADDSGLTLIPLNMAEPILIARGCDAPHGLGFSPHGAGRNFSRAAHMRRYGDKPKAEIIAEETKGIDARFFCGVPDVSELPSAYKNAASVRRQIAKFGLAEIVDTIEPIGNIMAGDWLSNAPWITKRRPSA